MTSWWRHHRGHGSLISGENGPFLACERNNLAISHPIFTKLDINDDMGSVTNHIWWRHDDVITDFTVHWLLTKSWKVYVYGRFWPLRVEIGQFWPHTSRKRIISAFRRAWPHVKIPTRTEVTAQNVNPICSFLAHLPLLSQITSSIYIRTSSNLVGLLTYD